MADEIPSIRGLSPERLAGLEFEIAYVNGDVFTVPKPSPPSIVAFEKKFKQSFTGATDQTFEQVMWIVWHTCKRKGLHPPGINMAFDKWLDEVDSYLPKVVDAPKRKR